MKATESCHDDRADSRPTANAGWLGTWPAVWSGVFRRNGQLRYSLLISWLAVNVISLCTLLHHPYYIYDATHHWNYLRVLSQGRLPVFAQTHQFFKPPLPYAFAAMLEALGMPEVVVWKLGMQLPQWLGGAVASWLVLWLARRMEKRGIVIGLTGLWMLGILPIWYRAMAFGRGESLALCFDLGFAALLVHAMTGGHISRRRSLAMGLLGGAAMLSIQWSATLLAAMGIWFLVNCFKLSIPRPRFLAMAGLCLAVVVLTSSWFYLASTMRSGQVTSFNRAPGMPIGDKDWRIYFDLSPRALFSQPVRPHMDGAGPAVYYAELWGDYWLYWKVRSIHRRGYYIAGRWAIPDWNAKIEQWIKTRPDIATSNYHSMASYLGRVNLLALLPTGVMLLAVGLGCRSLGRWLAYRRLSVANQITALAALVIVCTLLGYIWFVIRMPAAAADTVKATYTLQMYPWIALLCGVWLKRLWTRRPRLAGGLCIGLLIVALHNSPTLFSSYLPPWYGLLPRQLPEPPALRPKTAPMKTGAKSVTLYWHRHLFVADRRSL